MTITSEEVGQLCRRLQSEFERRFRDEGIDFVVGYGRNAVTAELVWGKTRFPQGWVVKVKYDDGSQLSQVESELRQRFDALFAARLRTE
jgi:hypothetical protein